MEEGQLGKNFGIEPNLHVFYQELKHFSLERDFTHRTMEDMSAEFSAVTNGCTAYASILEENRPADYMAMFTARNGPELEEELLSSSIKTFFSQLIYQQIPQEHIQTMCGWADLHDWDALTATCATQKESHPGVSSFWEKHRVFYQKMATFTTIFKRFFMSCPNRHPAHCYRLQVPRFDPRVLYANAKDPDSEVPMGLRWTFRGELVDVDNVNIDTLGLVALVPNYANMKRQRAGRDVTPMLIPAPVVSRARAAKVWTKYFEHQLWQPMTQEEFESLPLPPLEWREDTKAPCRLCLAPLFACRDRAAVKLPRCKHRFHRSCISDHLQMVSSACPYCELGTMEAFSLENGGEVARRVSTLNDKGVASRASTPNGKGMDSRASTPNAEEVSSPERVVTVCTPSPDSRVCTPSPEEVASRVGTPSPEEVARRVSSPSAKEVVSRVSTPNEGDYVIRVTTVNEGEVADRVSTPNESDLP